MLQIIANTHSRTGKADRDLKTLKKILDASDVEYEIHETQWPGHARVLAHELTQNITEDVNLIIMGGDGTLNEAINGIHDFEHTRVGLVPTGSGNDFARALGLKCDTAQAVERIIEDKEERRIDLGRVRYFDTEGSRLFAISSGMGMDAIVCKKALTSRLKKVLNKIGLGKLTYLLLTVQTLLEMVNTTAKVTYDGGKTVKYRRLIFIAAMNAAAEGGGVRMAPKATVDSGHFELCSAYAISKYVTFFVLPFLVLAKHEGFRCFDIKDFNTARVSLKEPMTVHADGEYCGEHMELEFICLPGKLRLIW